MTTSARRERIVQLLATRGYVPIDGLVTHFRVTPQTLRSDLNRLADEGRVIRHHGGASLPSSVANTAYATRRGELAREKMLMAQRLAAWLPDRVSLFLTLGTTMLAVAEALSARRGLKVITNHLEAAQVLVAHEETEVVLLGGHLERRNLGVSGTATLEAVDRYRADLCIFSVGGIDAQGNLLDYHDSEVDVVRQMRTRSRRSVLVVDHAKMGRSAAVRLGSIDDVSAIVVDRPLPLGLKRLLRGRNIQVLEASEPEVPTRRALRSRKD